MNEVIRTGVIFQIKGEAVHRTGDLRLRDNQYWITGMPRGTWAPHQAADIIIKASTDELTWRQSKYEILQDIEIVSVSDEFRRIHPPRNPCAVLLSGNSLADCAEGFPRARSRVPPLAA